MIALVTGPLGSGKSYYSVRAIGAALDAGKVVATNVELAPDTPERVAKSNLTRRLTPGGVRRKADKVRRSLFVADDLDELFALRLRGSEEGRGLMVLDEAHGWMNSRNWSDGNRQSIIRFFSQSRKLGWDVLLITQDAEMIDKQVRRLFEYHVHLRNLAKAKVLGVRVVPGNLFLAIWTWHATGTQVVVKREAFRLGWPKNLYETRQLTHGLADDDGDALWLPLEPGAIAPGSAWRGPGAELPAVHSAPEGAPPVVAVPSSGEAALSVGDTPVVGEAPPPLLAVPFPSASADRVHVVDPHPYPLTLDAERAPVGAPSPESTGDATPAEHVTG